MPNNNLLLEEMVLTKADNAFELAQAANGCSATLRFCKSVQIYREILKYFTKLLLPTVWSL